jgi:hypothetical protein
MRSGFDRLKDRRSALSAAQRAVSRADLRIGAPATFRYFNKFNQAECWKGLI